MRRARPLLAVVLAAATLAAGGPAAAQPADDWSVRRDPFDRAVIARYKAILARDPHDAGALAALLDLYRRYRTLDLLREEYARALDKAPDDGALLIVVARLRRQAGDDQAARELLARATARRPTDAAAWLLLGDLERQAGRGAPARAAYEQARARGATPATRKKALRALADLALAGGDADAASAYFREFLDLDPKNAQLWLERGDAMLAAGKRDVALESYAAAERLLAGDPPRRIEAVARQGQALEGLGRDDEAVAAYRRAIALAPRGYFLEVELTGRIVDIFRRKQALPSLLAAQEQAWPEGARGHFEWSTLGKLYEETGQQDKAIAALRRAVARAPWELETQRRLIALLENSGRDAEALAQYEAVVRAAPGEARFQLELAERYWRRGDQKQALAGLARVEGRFAGDPGVLTAVADLYARWGQEPLALAAYERLARLEPDDPAHLVTLGEQYFQKGDKARALATWRRIAASGKAGALARLGDVLAEHGELPEALASYDRAIALDDRNPELHKGRAAALEAAKQYPDALAARERVLALLGAAPADRAARRDARRRLVQLVVRWSAKEAEYRARWLRDLRRAPADAATVEAAYFLVEYYARRPQNGEPRQTLERLVALVPDDQEALLDLAKAYRAARRYDDAVARLLELARLAPSREREVFTQIAEIKTEARQDDEAIAWAQKALARSPRDPAAHARLAERYVEMQRFPEAIAAYEQAVALDPRDARSHFALAQLYVQAGRPLQAAQLYRQVLRTATDEEILGRAGREAIDLEELTGTLGELERVLSPLAFLMAHKPVYRRTLVDLYLRYVPLLAQRERHGDDEVRRAARAELDRVGAHGLPPLLEALRDDRDVAQQRVAVTVLGHLGNRGAAAPLVRLARLEPRADAAAAPRLDALADASERELRIDALVAAGRLGDPGLVGELLPLAEHAEVAMREAAIFALGRTGDRRAAPALRRALDDRRGSVQVLACLGLAEVDDGAAGAALVGVLADPRRDDAVRAACAYAAGARRRAAATPALLAALADNRGHAQRLAAWALGQLAEPRALGPLLRAYFARAGRPAEELRWAIGRVGGLGLPASTPAGTGPWPTRGGKFDGPAAVEALPGPLPAAPLPARLLVDHAADVAAGVVEALGEHRDVVAAALADLDRAPARLALGDLLPDGPVAPEATAALARIGATLAPAVAAHATDDDPRVRALAVAVLAKLDGDGGSAEDAVRRALADPALQVRAAGLAAIPVVAARRGAVPAGLATALLAALDGPTWQDRKLAAEQLGRIGGGGGGGGGGAGDAAQAALAARAQDPSGYVREAVAAALGARPAAGGALDALLALSADGLAPVRAAAARALATSLDPRARLRRAELAVDEDPVVRAAAGAP